jgi:imidazolonepropionase-like amidohydrolase
MRSSRLGPIVLALFLVNLCGVAVWAVPKTRPPAGLRENTPTVHAFTGARIVVSPGKVIANGTLVIRDGVITAVGADAKIPGTARIWDMQGKTLYPGLIDAYATLPHDAHTKTETGGYWNPNVTPEVRAEQIYRADRATNEKWRSQGVAVRLIAPEGGVIHGRSALVTTGDGDSSQVTLRDQTALHMKLTTRRVVHGDQYPNSPMGALALARQAFYDGRWYRDAWTAHLSKPALARPERSESLEVLARYLDKKSPVVIETGDLLYFLRAVAFTKEFELDSIVLGSGEEYQILDAVKASGLPVIVPLDFPKAPDVKSPEKASSVSLAKLLHWDLAPENPGRLDAAGVKIALAGHGLKEPSAFLPAVRRAVRRGLSADAALRALTITPASLFGVSDRLGSLEVGRAANFVITDGDLFDKQTKLLETWVDGQRYEVQTLPIADLRGTWDVQLEKTDGGSETLVVKLSGEPGKLSGSVHRGAKETKLTHAAVEGSQFTANFKGEPLGWTGMLRWSATLLKDVAAKDAVKKLSGVTWSGESNWPDGKKSSLVGRQTEAYTAPEKQAEKAKDPPKEKDKAQPETSPKKDEAPEKDNEKAKADGEKAGPDKANPVKADPEKSDKDEPDEKPALYGVTFPLGEYGLKGPPKSPSAVLFEHATVWTCGPDGVLTDASVLVEGGKIKAVGKNLKVPDGAVVVDALGKHLTPGIIDCHSHIATDGGVNETGQTITAEVRIGDFIDSQDINIYRQLAGGVTCANILHGSANTIGGQSQVIKFRWGSLPEALKFAQATPSIKFALGENVKQSNWGDRFHTRYPQTRMGVEQLVRDAFRSAIEYRRQWNDWRRNKNGLPPRVDLELEALAEVVSGKRIIHCHSYRQDEILALLRACEDYNVRIGTLQHILEGYKVADVMAKHGVGGSSFSDWWAYKFEVFDAIPYNGAIMHNAGVLVSFNSDDAELARRLNLEAAKAVKYGGVPEVEALKFVTLNPAKQLGVDKLVGSLEPGKDADLVVWSASPLSVYSRCEQTWIEGRQYFDRAADLGRQQEAAAMRTALIQRVLTSGLPIEDADEENKKDHWPREDLFCNHGDDEHHEEHGQ